MIGRSNAVGGGSVIPGEGNWLETQAQYFENADVWRFTIDYRSNNIVVIVCAYDEDLDMTAYGIVWVKNNEATPVSDMTELTVYNLAFDQNEIEWEIPNIRPTNQTVYYQLLNPPV